MPTFQDVAQIAAKLPGVIVSPDGLAFSVEVKGKEKGFAWAWSERVDPKKPRVKNLGVLALMVPSQTAKEIILGSDSDKFFTEPHYNGFPAVLVRLDKIELDELEDLLIEAWRSKAPADLRKSFEGLQ